MRFISYILQFPSEDSLSNSLANSPNSKSKNFSKVVKYYLNQYYLFIEKSGSLFSMGITSSPRGAFSENWQAKPATFLTSRSSKEKPHQSAQVPASKVRKIAFQNRLSMQPIMLLLYALPLFLTPNLFTNSRLVLEHPVLINEAPVSYLGMLLQPLPWHERPLVLVSSTQALLFPPKRWLNTRRKMETRIFLEKVITSRCLYLSLCRIETNANNIQNTINTRQSPPSFAFCCECTLNMDDKTLIILQCTSCCINSLKKSTCANDSFFKIVSITIFFLRSIQECVSFSKNTWAANSG